MPKRFKHRVSTGMRGALVGALLALAACGGGGSTPAPPVVVEPPPAPSGPDFSDVDASFQAFIDGTADFDGISYVLVSPDGIIHQQVFGDHTEDTVVLFASDNGGLSAHTRGGEPHTHNAPLRSGKGSAYEGGVRVPMAVRWPGRVAPGATERLPVQVEDVMPTLCELCGLDPACPDGDSFAPALLGDAQPAHPLFFHSPHYWGATGPGIEPFSAVRDGPLKLIWFYNRGAAELYDLDVDLGEADDLADRRPGDVARLRRILREHLTACGAQLPRRGAGEPVRLP